MFILYEHDLNRNNERGNNMATAAIIASVALLVSALGTFVGTVIKRRREARKDLARK